MCTGTRIATLLIAAVFLAVACESPPDGNGQPENAVYRGNGGEPGTLDPAKADDIHAFNILADLYEGLVAEAPDGQLVPGVAKSWTVSDDGLIYEFALDPAARWSDGSRVVAGDFTRSLRRVATPETASGYGYLLDPIAGFADALAGKTGADRIGVTAVDDDTLRITLSRPTGHLLSLLALAVTYPQHPSGAQSLISNGAYMLSSRPVRGPITIVRNPHYRNTDSVRVEKIVYYPVDNLQTELNMYRADELDITNSVPIDYVRAHREANGGELRISPSLALYYLAFDLSEAPFDNVALRRALSMAVDRRKLVDIIGRGESPAWSIVPPGVNGYDGPTYSWQDEEKSTRDSEAIDWYTQAGYGPDSPLQIRLLYDTGDIHETVALAVQSMWSGTLGAKVELEKRDWAYFLESRDRRGEWDVMRFAWFGDYNSPATFLEIFASGNPQNLSRYANAEFDSTLNAAMAEMNAAESARRFQEAEEILIRDYPVIPLYFFVSKHLVKPHIRGFEDSVTDRHPSRYLYIEY